MRLKILIFLLIIAIIFQGWYISQLEKYPVSLPAYSFVATDDFVVVEGSWASDTKIASENKQTTYFYCNKAKNECSEYTAFYGYMGGNQLSLFPTFYEIESWTSDKIICRENESAMCTRYNLTVDLKNKTVTNVRSTINPKPVGCETVDDSPIFLHLK